MNLFGTARLVMVVCGMIHGTISKDILSDVIIGNPDQVGNDILGSPISEKEIEDSLSMKISQHIDSKNDPITTAGLFQGDIIVQSKDHLLQILEGDPKGQLSAINNPRMIWPKGVIPYAISATFSRQERAVIARAIAEYRQRTCIRFVPRTTQTNYVHIIRAQGCSSAVGRTGGKQQMSLGNGCIHVGVVIHEMMHAAGFWHEQSRADRDDYVTIYWSNIKPSLQYNFEKNSNGVSTGLGLPYDYESIMHYGAYAFARNSRSPTIVPKKRGIRIGQRDGFSKTDVKGLNLLYKCSGVEPRPRPRPTPDKCTDAHRSCKYWAYNGYCKYNPGYMLVNCKKSCNACGRRRG